MTKPIHCKTANIQFSPDELSEVKKGASECNISLPRFIKRSALFQASHLPALSPYWRQEHSDLIIAIRQFGTYLSEIAHNSTRMQRLTVFDALKAKDRIHQLEDYISNQFITSDLHGNKVYD